jgi:hypothetical protein
MGDYDLDILKKYDPSFEVNSNEPFVKLGVPTFLAYSSRKHVKVVRNPNLAQIGFEKIFPPWYAYQEVEMYLGSVLCKKENPRCIIDDNILREAKGFDGRSFRMVSLGKKWKKRNRRNNNND